MADSYTHKDLAHLCSVSETTIKSYRRKFPGFIPVLTRGKPIRFKKEAGAVCLTIRECFDKGMSVRETHRILKEKFPQVAQVAPAKEPRTGGSSGVSDEYMEKFFRTAGQMMQGMAGLATAQAKAERRLVKVETALDKLLEIEMRNSEAFSELLTHIKEKPAVKSAPEPGAEKKVRTRKIVNVKSPEGTVKSYTIEKEDKPVEEAVRPAETSERPSDAFFNTPIVIKNDQDEFLGVPGRLPLSGFVEIMIREAEEGGVSKSGWHQVGEDWVLAMEAPGHDTHELYFESTTTPRGNLVVLLHRLDVNGEQTSSQFLQEFFRQIKDKV